MIERQKTRSGTYTTHSEVKMQHPPIATLRFFADNLSPDVITGVIPEKPTAAAAKGAAFKRRAGKRPVKARIGTWFITTKDRHLGNQPYKHLEWVVRLALDHIRDIRSQVPDVKADLSLLVHGTNFNISDLPPDLLKQAVEIGDLEIEIPEKGQDFFLNSQNLRSHLVRRA
jgi:hypothetical protein